MTHRTTPTASPNADGPFGLPPHIRHLVQTHSHETGEATEEPPTYAHSLAHHRELLPDIEGIRWTSTPSQWPLPISEQQISLGGYAAKTCPTATHHQFDPTAPAPQVIDDPADAQRKADGIEFEAHVLDLIEEVCGRADAAHPEGLWRIDEDQFQTIAPQTPIVTIQSTGAAEAVVQIPSRLVANSNQIQPIETVVILDAAPDTPIPASIVSTSTRTDPRTQTFEVSFAFEPPEELTILPGMTGTLRASSLMRSRALRMM